MEKLFDAILHDFIAVISRTKLTCIYDTEATLQKCEVEVEKINKEITSVVEKNKETAYVENDLMKVIEWLNG